MDYTMEQYQQSAQALQRRLGDFRPRVLLILGSGLGALADAVENPICVPYAEVPHMKRSPPRITRGSLYSESSPARM